MFSAGQIALFAPLVGFLIVFSFSQQLSDRWANVLTIVPMFLSLYAGAHVFYDACILGQLSSLYLAPFLHLGSLDVSWALYLDPLSGLMTGVVTCVSFLVHVYSVGYMHGQEGVPRFMSYLSFFTFCMLLLVMSSNLVQLFIGWEGVGLASYLLVGFYYKKESANVAAIKSFLVNRVGDAGYILGMCFVFSAFGSLNFSDIFSHVSGHAADIVNIPWIGAMPLMSVVSLLFFIGAMGKSAQLGLHVWLPDAMEGPTPVSALIHAATMVTAGVFLMTRLGCVLEYAPHVQTFIMIVGALTALVAATIACVQQDIKKSIAYSTCSQLGYMFMAVSCGAYGAAMFHLTTHAFFKALLFLGAGSVIHIFSGVQDMREMGGVWRLVPWTYGFMWIGSLALAGIPFLAGFYSKDAILSFLWGSSMPYSDFAWSVGVFVAFLTAFYSWRLLLKVFHGRLRASSMVIARVHESPWIMRAPLVVLSIGALFAGKVGFEAFVGEHTMWHYAILETQHLKHLALSVEALPTIASLLGVGLALCAYRFYPYMTDILCRYFAWIYQLWMRKWYFDDMYDLLLVRPSFRISQFFWRILDVNVLSVMCIQNLARFVDWCGGRLASYHTGYIQSYVLGMLLGLICLLFWLLHYYL
ncbi:NADH-quinone oxidoreductase subunit L [bacterium NHP-B]|nr:NADH-quinone oxidoreductase subunit L [bacterium NHP-B]